MKRSAGVIIVLNKEKVLLGHPSNASWSNSYSFPKGGIEKNETKLEAALRELHEETSIFINEKLICNSDEPIVVKYKDKHGEVYKKLYLYVAHISCVSEIGMDKEVIPIDKLQIEEMDWAGFLTKEQADKKIFHRVRYILDIIL